MPRRVPKVKPGEKITVDWANKIAEAVNLLLNISVSGPLAISVTGSGVSIVSNEQEVGFCGKLNATLSRGGNAMMSVWTVDESGGLGSDTGVDVKIRDIDQIPTGITLPSGTSVQGKWINGKRVLDAYDCSAV